MRYTVVIVLALACGPADLSRHPIEYRIRSARPIDREAAFAVAAETAHRELGLVAIDRGLTAFVVVEDAPAGTSVRAVYVVQVSQPIDQACYACLTPYALQLTVTPVAIRDGRAVSDRSLSDAAWEQARAIGRVLERELLREQVISTGTESEPVLCHEVTDTGTLFSHRECGTSPHSVPTERTLREMRPVQQSSDKH